MPRCGTASRSCDDACVDEKATYRAGMTQHIETDVAIVGAGPVGLFAVFELGMLKLTSVLLDAMAEIDLSFVEVYARPNRVEEPTASIIDSQFQVGVAIV